METKQVIFLDPKNEGQFGGILCDNKFIICGIYEVEEVEIIFSYNDYWKDFSQRIKDGEW